LIRAKQHLLQVLISFAHNITRVLTMVATFLGTGTSQGVPVITCGCEVCKSGDPRDKRLRSSLMINTGTENFVIDSGPDFRYQMLRENVKSLHSIILTHQHKDHIAGLDDVRAFNYTNKRAMHVYGSEHVLKAIRNEFAYAFTAEKYPGVPEIMLNVIHNERFTIDGLDILPIQVFHYKMPVFGYRLHDFIYVTDASSISAEEKNKMKNAEILVINALRPAKHISHFNLEEALALIEELKPQKAYLTHMSHNMHKYAMLAPLLPPNVFPAYDGLKLYFS